MHRLLFLGLIALFIATPTYAQTPNIESAFREYGMVGPINVIVPTVIELPIYESVAQSGEYMVIEEKTGMPQPSFLRQTFIQNPELVDVRVYGQSEPQLTDGNRYSGRRFEITSTVDGRVSIELISRVPVTSSHIDFAFGQNVAYPTRIQVIAYGDSGNENIVYRESAFYGTALAFIPTTARHWRVDLVYAQPLQINEIVLSQDSVEQSVSRGLRFLGQPNSSYRIFQDPDRYVSVPYGVSGNLMENEDIEILPAPVWIQNLSYRPADIDNDEIPDTRDNCVTLMNPDQSDIDRNGKGDACDDYDRDGYLNNVDNCKNIPNYQQDEDGDGIGDECDAEESRFTERLPWVPWVGMGIAGFVLFGLFVFVAIDVRNKKPIV